MSKSKKRNFEIVSGIIAAVFLAAIPTAAALSLKKFLFDSGAYESWPMYQTVLLIIGVSVYAILSILSNTYVVVKMFKGSLRRNTNLFFLVLIMLFSCLVPGILAIIDRSIVGYDEDEVKERAEKALEELESRGTKTTTTVKKEKPMKKGSGLTELLEAE